MVDGAVDVVLLIIIIIVFQHPKCGRESGELEKSSLMDPIFTD